MNRFERLYEAMKQRGFDAILVASNTNVRYLSGYSPDLETGPNPMEPGPALLRIERAGHGLTGAIVLPEGSEASVQVPWIECHPYEAYNVETLGYDRLHAYRKGIEKVLLGIPSGIKVGMETPWITAEMKELIAGRVRWEDCCGLMKTIRMVKDDDELFAIREAIRLANVGQHAVRHFAHAGMQEIELFSKVKGEMEKAAGTRIALIADFISGPKTAGMGGPPTNRQLQSGDLLLTDLVPYFNGYWGDSCNVTSVGEVAPSIRTVFQHVSTALEIAKSSIRPGINVREIDTKVREYLRKEGLFFPHHTGHGLGIDYHEGPLISPNGTEILQENMVIALEPGAYLEKEGFGIRLEDIGRVTSDGFEQWTEYPFAL